MPSAREVCLGLLAYGDMTNHDLASTAQININTVVSAMRHALLLREVHIHDWDTHIGSSGRATPIWRLGPGKDKPKPRPLTKNERNARSRERHRAEERVRAAKYRGAEVCNTWLSVLKV